MSLWSLVGVIAVCIVGVRFIMQLGKNIPMLELMLLLAGLQWIIGPLIEYTSPSLHYKYYMYVPQQTYMAFIAPAYAIFVSVVLFGIRNYKTLLVPITDLKTFKKYGIAVFLVGVFFDLIASRLPGTLGFFAFIVANFKFAGALILFFSEDPRLKKIFYGSLVYLFVSALQHALFHDLILWTVFFYMFWALKYKPSVRTIALTLLVGALSLTTLQTIKAAYRLQVWNGYDGNKLELFAGLVVDAVLLHGANAGELDGELNTVRLNQGWIISAIMDEIPDRVAFLHGETIREAVSASILPRFLNPNKKKAGGQENFRKFTGLNIGDNTSMGISIIGEAYGNYGPSKGLVFMGFWGFFLVIFWRYLLKKTPKNSMLLAFIPIIFLQAVKAETELVVVLNHLVKSSIVVFLFFWGTKRFLNWKFTDDKNN